MADILTIGSSGLSAYRRSLEVTGNNIVNANTEGYARRDVQLQGLIEAGTTPTALRTGSGGGVAIDVIRRATDTFVQAEMRTAASSSAEATALADRLDRLEKIFFLLTQIYQQQSRTSLEKFKTLRARPHQSQSG